MCVYGTNITNAFTARQFQKQKQLYCLKRILNYDCQKSVSKNNAIIRSIHFGQNYMKLYSYIHYNVLFP